MYRVIRPLLFALPEERSHKIALSALALCHKCHLTACLKANKLTAPKKIMGLTFKNPVGLAAGFDKDGDYIDDLASLGFGFIEIGTVTPRPQPGNHKPRLFRLPQAEAIINRMGFNSKGLDYLLNRLANRKKQTLLGINIGKNLSTPVEDAQRDYLLGLERVYSYADYITVNISSPNTPGLRDLQQSERLKKLLSELKERHSQLATQHGSYVPLVVKISPDLSAAELIELAALLKQMEIDAVIATNTTIDHGAVKNLTHGDEKGGLSGKPLREKATTAVTTLYQALNGDIPIIAVGGIMDAAAAEEKFAAGASLLQLYSGLIYRGPQLISEIVAQC
ncbi:MAG: quinone-dependent dihydroorotate dehydrogenase [Gammaproteobacteria bacterium]|nr:quinone-dependent dihydroorotate dehydrogenase [Gammaproteobacteria bacterium]